MIKRVDKNILEIINKNSNLSLKVNMGKRYRVSKLGYKGSLWLELQKKAYRVKLTGDVKEELSKFIVSNFGQESHHDQGSPVWHLPLNGAMEKLVSEFNKI